MTENQFFLVLANIWIASTIVSKGSDHLIATTFGLLYLAIAIFLGVSK
jgi:hypothetical protein